MPRDDDKNILTKHLLFLKDEYKDYDRFSPVTWKEYMTDRDLRRNLERWIENIINSSIDIAKLLLRIHDQPIPQTYREILLHIGLLPNFSEDFGNQLSRFAKLRNFLAHEYLDMRWDNIKNFIKESKTIYPEFMAKVTEIVKSSDER